MHCLQLYFRLRGQKDLLLYLSTQIRFPIGGELVTCRWSKLTNSLGKKQLKLSTRTWPGRGPWNCGKFGCQSASTKRFFCSFVFYFWVGKYNKTLNDWLTGKHSLLFPLDLNVPRGEAEVLGKQNSLFPLGPIIKCSLYVPPNWNKSDWRRTCHVSWVKTGWLTPKQNNNLNFRLARDQVMHLETVANLFASLCQANIFFAVWYTFELRGIAKHLMRLLRCTR